MIGFAVTPSSFPHAEFRLLCMIGSFAGAAVIFLGLGFERKVRFRQRADSQGTNPALTQATEPASLTKVPQEIIQLSTELAATRSSEMTQQQKIAAALGRAGIASPAWGDPNSGPVTMAVMEPPSESSTREKRLPPNESAAGGTLWNARAVILAGGVMLFVMSLGLLVVIH